MTTTFKLFRLSAFFFYLVMFIRLFTDSIPLKYAAGITGLTTFVLYVWMYATKRDYKRSCWCRK